MSNAKNSNENIDDVLDSPVVVNSNGEPWKSVNGIDKIYSTVIKRHGFRHCTLHGIRSSVATMLHNNDVSINEISKLLGHAHISTTEKNYIKKNKQINPECAVQKEFNNAVGENV